MPTKFDGIIVNVLLGVDEYKRFETICKGYDKSPAEVLQAFVSATVNSTTIPGKEKNAK